MAMALVGITSIVVVIRLTLVILIIRIRVALLMMAMAIIVMALLRVSRHDCVFESPPSKSMVSKYSRGSFRSLIKLSFPVLRA